MNVEFVKKALLELETLEKYPTMEARIQHPPRALDIRMMLMLYDELGLHTEYFKSIWNTLGIHNKTLIEINKTLERLIDAIYDLESTINPNPS